MSAALVFLSAIPLAMVFVCDDTIKKSKVPAVGVDGLDRKVSCCTYRVYVASLSRMLSFKNHCQKSTIRSRAYLCCGMILNSQTASPKLQEVRVSSPLDLVVHTGSGTCTFNTYL
jgi:hypothetical protein